MNILGIDPGTATTGYGLIQVKKDTSVLVDFGWIKTLKDGKPEKRLNDIYKGINALLRKYSPDVMAIEQLFFYSNAKTAMRVGQAHGVILLAAARQRVQVFEYAPGQVKLTVSGNGRADKNAMKRAIRLLYKIRAPKKKKTHFDDVADAIAVALCHAKLASGK